MRHSIDIKQLLKNNVEEKKADVFSVAMQREILKRLENAEKEKGRIVEKLIDAYAKAYIKSKIIDTPRETLIRWDGHKEGISEAIDIVKGSEE